MIPYGRHSITESDISAVIGALKSDWLTTGPLVEVFENLLTEVAGAPCIAVSSGTAALHCAYVAIGLQPGDEVITPPITFIATQAAAALVGAKVVFADVQIDTANIDAQAVAAAITSKTKAIVAVDYAGHPADLDELRSLADKYGIYLIEDAAHSIGSIYKGRPVGSIADITTFSFFPTKNFTTGEGGAVASKNPLLLERAKRFARQGLIREKEKFFISDQGPWHQEVHEFGLNYRLTDILCALGISQINRLQEFKNQKKQIYDNYIEMLSDVGSLQTPIERTYVESNWHLFPIRIDPKIRLEVFNALRSHGIGVQVNYIPAYWHPVFQNLGYRKGMYPASDLFYSQEISLPMFATLTFAEVDYIASTLKRLLKVSRKK
jgi:dTDP-4-amino-4,6-dideoxygalactose transaminase